MFECEFCKKTYKSKSNLQYHKKITKKCLKIQKEKLMCNICTIQFENEQLYNNHLENCKNSLEILKEQLQSKAEEAKRLQEQLFELAKIGTKKKTVVINNRVNKVDQRVLNQLAPYSLNEEKIASIVEEKFNKKYLMLEELGLVDFAMKNLLTDEEGKRQMICTDSARRNFLCKNDNNEPFKDPDATNFTGMYIPPIEKKSGKILREMDEDTDEIECGMILKGISNLEKIKKNNSILTSHLAKRLSVKPE